jgi:hypothetical protein
VKAGEALLDLRVAACIAIARITCIAIARVTCIAIARATDIATTRAALVAVPRVGPARRIVAPRAATHLTRARRRHGRPDLARLGHPACARAREQACDRTLRLVAA